MTYAVKAFELATKLNTPLASVFAYNALGNAHYHRRQDSSFYYYSRALRIADSAGLPAEMSRPLLNLAGIYVTASNLQMALSLVDSSIALAGKYNKYSILADAYNMQGLISISIYDSARAKASFIKAIETGNEKQYFRQCGNAIANLSLFETNIEIKKELLFKALGFYNHIKGLDEERAFVYVNLGSNQTDPDSAIFYYNAALEIASAGGLTEPYVSASNNLTYSFLEKKDLKNALACIEKAISIAEAKPVSDWLPTLYDTYADVLIEKGNLSKAISAQKKAYQFRKSFDNEKALSQTRILSAILDLRSKDALIMQKDNDLVLEKSSNIKLRLLAAILFLTITAILLFQLWIRQRNLRRQAEVQVMAASKIIEYEEYEKRRLGFELHDHLGFLVRSIHQYINEYNFTGKSEKEEILNKVNELRSSIRRFSHHLNPYYIEKEKFRDIFIDLITDFSSITGNNINYFIGSNLPDLGSKQMLHIIRILQELITNSAKHAEGAGIQIDFTRIDGSLIMVYKDNGPGFLITDKGFGLQSIEERVKILKGKSKLITGRGRGLIFEFEFPVKN